MHYPDAAFPVNTTAGDAPLIVFCHKRAEEAHITVLEVEGWGGNMEELTTMELFKFHIDFFFLDLTSTLQMLTYLDILSELLAHMDNLHADNVAYHLESFEAAFFVCLFCLLNYSSKSALLHLW